jgi:hypothetical protein
MAALKEGFESHEQDEVPRTVSRLTLITVSVLLLAVAAAAFLIYRSRGSRVERGTRGLIELEDSATNHEYMRRVSRFNVLASPMSYMTDRFDYVWYGMFPSSEEDFAAYRSHYDEAMARASTINDPASSAN